MKRFLLLLAGLMSTIPALIAAEAPEPKWSADFKTELPLMGHRNWIAIVDSAYPLQNATGIQTVNTGADQIDVVRQVLAILKTSGHVRGIVYLDAELPFVAESAAHGIDAYRSELLQALKGSAPISLLHEQIISRIDEAGKTFRVLILKTRLTLPYTSVFIQLECGYWTAEAEKALRSAISSSR
jgi:L-fucose mutarotase/ribose pyranase (RbsD/FucU family)